MAPGMACPPVEVPIGQTIRGFVTKTGLYNRVSAGSIFIDLGLALQRTSRDFELIDQIILKGQRRLGKRRYRAVPSRRCGNTIQERSHLGCNPRHILLFYGLDTSHI